MSSWERNTAGGGGGAGADGGGAAEDTPAPLDEPREAAEMSVIDGRGAETATRTEQRTAAAASDLEQGRSPVEEEGHEVDGDEEDEELGSAVEEGEEAALALDAPATEADMAWVSVVQAAVGHSQETGPLPCHSREEETSPVPCLSQEDRSNIGEPKGNQVSDSFPMRQSPDFTSTEGWDIHCQSRQSDSCYGDNLA